jgi:hypothetical protein
MNQLNGYDVEDLRVGMSASTGSAKGFPPAILTCARY